MVVLINVLLSFPFLEQATIAETAEAGEVDPEGGGVAGEGAKKKKKKKKKKGGGGGAEGEPTDDYLHPGSNPTGNLL